MSIEISEVHLTGRLRDFTPVQQRQMATWLGYYGERGDNHAGVVRSAELVVARANQGAIWPVAKATIDGMIDKATGLRSYAPLDTDGWGEKVGYTLCRLGPFQLLDGCFFVYGDGSISVGYDNTGFVVAEDDSATILHPPTRFAFQLPEKEYDLTFRQNRAITGRTLFFYRLVQACTAILEAEAATQQAEKGGEA